MVHFMQYEVYFNHKKLNETERQQPRLGSKVCTGRCVTCPLPSGHHPFSCHQCTLLFTSLTLNLQTPLSSSAPQWPRFAEGWGSVSLKLALQGFPLLRPPFLYKMTGQNPRTSAPHFLIRRPSFSRRSLKMACCILQV